MIKRWGEGGGGLRHGEMEGGVVSKRWGGGG